MAEALAVEFFIVLYLLVCFGVLVVLSWLGVPL